MVRVSAAQRIARLNRQNGFLEIRRSRANMALATPDESGARRRLSTSSAESPSREQKKGANLAIRAFTLRFCCSSVRIRDRGGLGHLELRLCQRTDDIGFHRLLGCVAHGSQFTDEKKLCPFEHFLFAE